MADETGDLFAANLDAGQPLFASQSLAEIEAHLAGVGRSDCRCSDSTHENAVHDLIHIDMPVLIAEVKRLRQKLAGVKEIAQGHHLLIAGGEQEIAELTKFVETVKAFIDARPEYVAALKSGPADDADYHRWSGGAEARRQLAQALGFTVPHEWGDKTTPKTKEATTNA